MSAWLLRLDTSSAKRHILPPANVFVLRAFASFSGPTRLCYAVAAADTRLGEAREWKLDSVPLGDAPVTDGHAKATAKGAKPEARSRSASLRGTMWRTFLGGRSFARSWGGWQQRTVQGRWLSFASPSEYSRVLRKPSFAVAP
eukprot:scaffold3300_cov239-Pinguiococcus_pyrenoidosus.AAC.2